MRQTGYAVSYSTMLQMPYFPSLLPSFALSSEALVIWHLLVEIKTTITTKNVNIRRAAVLAWAAVTKCYTLGSLKRDFYFSQLWRLGSPWSVWRWLQCCEHALPVFSVSPHMAFPWCLYVCVCKHTHTHT